MNKRIKKLIALALALSLCLTPAAVCKTKADSINIKVKSIYFLINGSESKVTKIIPVYKTHKSNINEFFKNKKTVKGKTSYQYTLGGSSIETPKTIHCTVKSVYLTGYKNNKPIKKGDWIEEKYLKKGTLTYKYKKLGKIKKPKVKFGHVRGELVDNVTILEPYAHITGIKSNTYVLSGTYQIKPVYFKNTTGKGTNKTSLKIHPYDALNGRAASNFEMYRYFKGSYKSIRSLVYSLKLTYLDMKISKGTPKIVKKTCTYYGKSTLNKKAPKKCAKEKLKLYNNDTSTLIK